MATDYERAIETLWKDVRDLRADLKAVVEAMRQSAREKASDARESVTDTAEKGAGRVREFAEDAVECGQRALKDIGRKIEDRPLASLATAVGIGLVIGSILHWRMGK